MINFIIKYWLQFIFGIIISILTFVYKKIGNYYYELNTTKNGVKILLKNEIIKKYHQYKCTGCITIAEKEIIEDLYQEYKNLGGNGMIEKLVLEINNIPIKENCGDN